MKTGKKMSKAEEDWLLSQIDKPELREEIENLDDPVYRSFLKSDFKYPNYLKAVMATLIAMNYDEDYIRYEFSDKMDAAFGLDR